MWGWRIRNFESYIKRFTYILKSLKWTYITYPQMEISCWNVILFHLINSKNQGASMNHLFTHFINNFYWEISFEIIFLVLNPRCLTSMTHKLNPILTNINHSTSTLLLSKQNEYWKHEYLIDTNLGSSNFSHEWNWVRTQLKGQFLGNSANLTNFTNHQRNVIVNHTNLTNFTNYWNLLIFKCFFVKVCKVCKRFVKRSVVYFRTKGL